MSKYSFSYFISQSFKGLWRNGVMSLASILVLMSCLVVMGSFSLLVYNINVNLENVGALNEIVVFCDEDYTEEQISEIGRQIRLLDNVDEENVVHITKEDAMEQTREDYRGTEYEVLFEEMDERGTNPFRDSYVIPYEDNAQVSTLEYQLGQIEGVAKIECRADLAETVENLKNGIIFVFMWFLAILFVVSLFVIINTIKLAVFARRQEISIMRYVGATKAFITLPFVFEGILIGIIASGVAYLIQWYVYSYIDKLITQDYGLISIVGFSELNTYVILGFLAVGVFTGIVGSMISLSKYLKA